MIAKCGSARSQDERKSDSSLGPSGTSRKRGESRIRFRTSDGYTLQQELHVQHLGGIANRPAESVLEGQVLTFSTNEMAGSPAWAATTPRPAARNSRRSARMKCHRRRHRFLQIDHHADPHQGSGCRSAGIMQTTSWPWIEPPSQTAPPSRQGGRGCLSFSETSCPVGH